MSPQTYRVFLFLPANHYVPVLALLSLSNRCDHRIDSSFHLSIDSREVVLNWVSLCMANGVFSLPARISPVDSFCLQPAVPQAVLLFGSLLHRNLTPAYYTLYTVHCQARRFVFGRRTYEARKGTLPPCYDGVSLPISLRDRPVRIIILYVKMPRSGTRLRQVNWQESLRLCTPPCEYESPVQHFLNVPTSGLSEDGEITPGVDFGPPQRAAE